MCNRHDLLQGCVQHWRVFDNLGVKNFTIMPPFINAAHQFYATVPIIVVCTIKNDLLMDSKTMPRYARY